MIKAERSFVAAYNLNSALRISTPLEDLPSAKQKAPSLFDVKKLTLFSPHLKNLHNLLE